MKRVSLSTETSPVTSALDAVVRAFEAQNGLDRFSPGERFTEQTGIDRVRFWRLRTGRTEAKASELRRLSVFFGCDMESLVDLPAQVAA